MIAKAGLCARPRGFSLRELGLTLLLLAVVIVGALRFIDLRTKLLVVEKDESGPRSVLEAAARALSRDVKAAGRGGLPLDAAVRVVADNTRADAGAAYADVSGAAVPVRPGTDQLGLRGVLRTQRLALRLPGAGAGPESAGGRSPADASSVWLAAGALPGGGTPPGGDALRGAVERLSAPHRPKRFFLVTDREGRSAVARVLEWRRLGGETGLELRLDFTDAEAVRLDPRGNVDTAAALSEPAVGGLLDDVVWFVARGAAGHFPDYDAARDPPSVKFPHPYLAAAEFAGNGRWEIAHVGEDVEEFQVAAESGAAGTLRVAWTAKAERRFVRADGPRPPLESPALLNAPAPGSVPAAGPVGWDPDEGRRVPFERATQEFVLAAGGAPSDPPAGAPARVK